jgi:ribosomal 50S subunit-recycling heat shock protein
MATKNVKLVVGPTGRGRVTIDGEEVKNVRGVRIDARVGEATSVTLELTNVAVEVEAVGAQALAEVTSVDSESREFYEL